MLVAAATYGGIIFLLRSWSGFQTLVPQAPLAADLLSQLGLALVSPSGYVVPFEVASILLLAALIGAIVIAWPRKESES
jgi:NADH-quinone oxidoreductase subunit J